jgi:ferredoxin
MKLTASELAYVRAQGLYITEKCDGCGKLLNQTFRYTIKDRVGTFCSAACRDSAFFGARGEAEKYTRPGRCAYCGGCLKAKKRGSIFCDDTCRKAHSRKIPRITAAKVEKSRTPTQSNQAVRDAKTVEQGDRIAGGLRPLRNARGEGAARIGLPVEVGQAISGSRSS